MIFKNLITKWICQFQPSFESFSQGYLESWLKKKINLKSKYSNSGAWSTDPLFGKHPHAALYFLHIRTKTERSNGPFFSDTQPDTGKRTHFLIFPGWFGYSAKRWGQVNCPLRGPFKQTPKQMSELLCVENKSATFLSPGWMDHLHLKDVSGWAPLKGTCVATYVSFQLGRMLQGAVVKRPSFGGNGS